MKRQIVYVIIFSQRSLWITDSYESIYEYPNYVYPVYRQTLK